MYACGTHLLTAVQPRTGGDRDRLEIAVRGAKTAAMGDGHRKHAGHGTGEGHSTEVGRSDRSADFSGVIDAPMS